MSQDKRPSRVTRVTPAPAAAASGNRSTNEAGHSAFRAAGEEKQASVVGEFYAFLKANKKFWLIPLLVALGLLGLIVVLGSTAAAPFIYTLF